MTVNKYILSHKIKHFVPSFNSQFSNNHNGYSIKTVAKNLPYNNRYLKNIPSNPSTNQLHTPVQSYLRETYGAHHEVTDIPYILFLSMLILHVHRNNFGKGEGGGGTERLLGTGRLIFKKLNNIGNITKKHKWGCMLPLYLPVSTAMISDIRNSSTLKPK